MRAGLAVMVLSLLAGACAGSEGQQAGREEANPTARGHTAAGEWTAPPEARARENPVEPTQASVQQGKMIYRGHCYLCHGREGRGDGPWVEMLPKKPADLTAPQRLGRMTDGELFWKISRGRDMMPSFEDKLSEKQRWQVVNYLRALAAAREGN